MKKIGIICGIAWLIFAIPFLPPFYMTGENLALGIMMQVGLVVGIITIIIIIIMALIDYARRPR